MKFLNKQLICTILSLGVFASATANTSDESAAFKRYEQAKLKLAYEGEVGDLLQLLSNRLNIGYLSYKTDPTQKIKITSSVPITVKSLIDDVQTQLPELTIKFEKIGETVFITANNKQSPLKLKQDQFISEAIFDEETPSEKPVVVQPKEGNQIEVILDSDTVKDAAPQEENNAKKP